MTEYPLDVAAYTHIYFKDLRVARCIQTALAGGLGEMSLVNDYQMFRTNLGSSSVVVT